MSRPPAHPDRRWKEKTASLTGVFTSIISWILQAIILKHFVSLIYSLGSIFSPETGSLRNSLIVQRLASEMFWNSLTRSLWRARISGRYFTSLSSVSWREKRDPWVKLSLDKMQFWILLLNYFLDITKKYIYIFYTCSSRLSKVMMRKTL